MFGNFWRGLHANLLTVVAYLALLLLAGELARRIYLGERDLAEILLLLGALLVAAGVASRPAGRWQKIGRAVASAGTRLNDNLVRVIGWLALGFLIWLLKRRVETQEPESDPGELLLILLAIVIAAALVQLGSQVLGRLKRVGPVEFFEREVGDLLEPLRRFIPLGSRSEAGGEVSQEEKHECEKADFFVSTLEFSGVDEKELSNREDFHDLLFKIGSIAMKLKDWARAAERFDQLGRVSGGRYQPAKLAYNSGVNYLLWATETGDEEARKRLLRRALRRLEAAVEKDSSNHLAYFQLAWVEDELGMYKWAVRHNEQALDIQPRFSVAKYNGAISTLKLGNQAEAFRRLQQLSPDDDLIQHTVEQARGDDELEQLRVSEEFGPPLEALLSSLEKKSGPG